MPSHMRNVIVAAHSLADKDAPIDADTHALACHFLSEDYHTMSNCVQAALLKCEPSKLSFYSW